MDGWDETHPIERLPSPPLQTNAAAAAAAAAPEERKFFGGREGEVSRMMNKGNGLWKNGVTAKGWMTLNVTYCHYSVALPAAVDLCSIAGKILK
jgi:hypothetical protein